MKLNDKQMKAYKLMLSGQSVFITGAAGVGKTAVIKKYITQSRYMYGIKKVGLTSTTGISALLFGGTTLHSFLGIGLGKGTAASICTRVSKYKFLLNRWKDLQVLVIDEVSMLSPTLFDKLEQVARTLRRNDRPFGGIQLILSGDFLQLPNVGSDDFCFEAESWATCIKHTICLTEIIRQNNQTFQKCLNAVRLGDIDDETKRVLNSRVGATITNAHGIEPTRLYSTNRDVDAINDAALDALAEAGAEFCEYTVDVDFATTLSGDRKKTQRERTYDRYSKMWSFPETLQLCIGAQVLLLHNLSPDTGLVNGSRGVVVGFSDDDDLPIVRFMNGAKMAIPFHTWEFKDGDKLLMRAHQIPLKPAYALTIHRSQGCSLDCAEVDLSNPFEYGMGYVALSRVRTLEGLSLRGIDYSRVQAHPKAVAFYESL